MKYNWTVQLEPYRLDAGHVGEDIFRPVVVSRHRSAKAAARAIIRQIRGTDPQAREYLESSRGGRYPIALRYVARASEAPFKAYSAAQLLALD